MQIETALRWSWMNVMTAKRYTLLLETFKDLDGALAHVSVEMLRQLGCREDTALTTMNRLEEFDSQEHAALLATRGIRLVSCEDADYPSVLHEIEDKPVFLYARGDIGILQEPCIALVGTRDMSAYGKRVTEHIVPPLVKSGLVTVSGLAAGIDAEVAKETIRAGGKHAAVLGHGMAMMFPKAHDKLADEIVDSGGLILSEYAYDIRSEKFNFPARNRIIAGLSLGTVVLEAAEGSGSLITADLALDYNRDVFAVPGQIFDSNYAGCHHLLTRGVAKLARGSDDILSELGMAHGRAPEPISSFTADSPEEEAVWTSLTAMPSALDDLVVKAKLDAATVNATLTILELKGSARNLGGGKWIKA